MLAYRIVAIMDVALVEVIRNILKRVYTTISLFTLLLMIFSDTMPHKLDAITQKASILAGNEHKRSETACAKNSLSGKAKLWLVFQMALMYKLLVTMLVTAIKTRDPSLIFSKYIPGSVLSLEQYCSQ